MWFKFRLNVVVENGLYKYHELQSNILKTRNAYREHNKYRNNIENDSINIYEFYRNSLICLVIGLFISGIKFVCELIVYKQLLNLYLMVYIYKLYHKFKL